MMIRFVVGFEIACAGPASTAATISSQYCDENAATTRATAEPPKISSICDRALITSARRPNQILITAAEANTTVTTRPNSPAVMPKRSIISADETATP